MRRPQKFSRLFARARRDYFDAPVAHQAQGSPTWSNIKVTASAQLVRFLVQVGSTVVLARLLTPSDFGLVAMVAVFLNLIVLIKDAGLAQATVQRATIRHEQISALFWVNIFLSVAVAGLVVAIAPVVAWLYGERRLFGVTVALALPILFAGAALQHRALLQRDLQFKKLAVADIGSLLVGTSCGAVFAMLGFGFWSLVLMQCATALTNGAIIWIASGWIPGAFLRGTGIRSMLGFGANLFGFNAINYFARNADNFLIGKVIGAEALGQYSRAYSLMLLPISQLNAPLVAVLFPTLSRLQDQGEEFARVFLKYVRAVAWLTVPAITLAHLFGEQVIVFLLGERWRPAGEVFRILALAALLQPVASLHGLLFTSTGQTGKMLRWGLFSAPLICVAFVVGVRHGASGVAMAYAVVMTFLAPTLWWYASQGTPVTFVSILRAVGGPVGLSFATYFCYTIWLSMR